jgi:hypothetical protein
MLRVDRRAGGDGSGSGCNTMLPKPLEGDFLLVLPLLFVRLPPLRGEALFGGPFLLRQVALLLTSPTLDAAAPDVPPFALSGPSMPDMRSSIFYF